jgi:hypothetical protein
LPAAFPFALAWFVAMIFLFFCFGLVGPVFGNVLQSTRGLMSIMAGAWLARAGFQRIEKAVSRRALLQRLAAAAMMTAAIWIFQINKHT